MSSLNPDAKEGRKHNSATVPYLEYFYPKYSRDPRFNWDEQILVEQDKALPRDPCGSNGGCEESVQETGKNQFTLPTQATGISQPNKEQRKVSEHVGTRLNDSTVSLLMIADDLGGGV
jgi:hypothetical protein